MSRILNLTLCNLGEIGEIVEIDTSDRAILGKLMSLGIVPGSLFCLIQKKPGYLLQVGYTRVALDIKLSEYIYVRKDNCRKVF